MIREIEKPNIKFNFGIYNNSKFYYDKENNEYFIKYKDSIVYFNLNGFVHRVGKPARLNEEYKIYNYLENGILTRNDGPAASCCTEKHQGYYLNNNYYNLNNWSKETNHLICKFCNNFCKQGCFL